MINVLLVTNWESSVIVQLFVFLSVLSLHDLSFPFSFRHWPFFLRDLFTICSQWIIQAAEYLWLEKMHHD